MKNKSFTRDKLIDKLKRNFEVPQGLGSDTALANCLGATSRKRNSWKVKITKWRQNSNPLSDTEILNLVKDIRDASIHKEVIKTIVEYFPIEKVASTGEMNYEISPPDDDDIKRKWDALRKDLEKTKAGVYIFYDSSGRAIYVGKTATKKGSLWLRMKSSFNHYQKKSRQVYRIDHSSDANLGPKPVQLHEVAKYFSAYMIHPELTHNIEALLIRAFADNLMNKRMENFNN